MKESGFFVYIIHNIVNNKIYVGKTTNPNKRWKSHISHALHKYTNQYIHKAIRKYGVNNFSFSIIQELKNELEYNLCEIYWISFFQSNNSIYGYNLTLGGDGSSGRKQTEITRQKISTANSGKYDGENNPFYGKHHTSEVKEKISDANTGLKRTDEFKRTKSDNMRGDKNHFYGQIHSETTLEKIRGENNFNAKLSEEKVLKIISLYKTNMYSQKELSTMFGVSQTQVSRIVKGERWKHLLVEIK